MAAETGSAKDWQEYLEVLGFSTPLWESPTEAPSPTNLTRRPALVFVNEAAPEEKLSGRLENLDPYRGESGELLAKMVFAMGIAPERMLFLQVARPKAPSSADELRVAFDRSLEELRAQILQISPFVVVTLGQFASQLLLQSQQSLPEMRGAFRRKDFLKDADGQTIPVMPTFHPAYLIREPSMKKAAWEDLKQVMKWIQEKE